MTSTAELTIKQCNELRSQGHHDAWNGLWTKYWVWRDGRAMLVPKFRDHVRSRTPVAMVNEVLCKLISHNICVLIQEAHELGIEVNFQGN
jgi:hypothetical protein